MPDRRRVLLNLASLTASRILWRGLGAIIMILLARHLGVELFGIYAAAFSFATLASMFTEVGIGQVLLRSVSRNDPESATTFGNSLSLKLALIAFTYAAMMLVSRLMGHDPRLFEALAIIGLGVFATSAHQIPIVVLQGLQRMHLVAVFQAFASLLALISVGCAIVARGDFFTVTLVQSLAAVVPLPLMLIVAARAIRPRLERASMKRLITEGMPFGVMGAFYVLLQQGPVVMLERFASSSEVGLFSAAFRPVALLYVLPHVVSSVLAPSMFKAAVEDREQHRRLSITLVTRLGAIGFAISTLVFLFAEPIVLVLLGAEYTGAVPLMRILCWFLTLQCLSYPLGDVLTTADFNRQRIVGLVVGCAVLIGGNLYAIPRHGAQGAAVVTLVAEATVALVLGFFVRTMVRASAGDRSP